MNKICNPNKPTEFKYGDVRADGFIFHAYGWRKKQNRWYESWRSPDGWKRRVEGQVEYQAKPENKKKAVTYQRRWHGLPEPTRPCPDVCECCGNPPSSKKGLALDHDHETGEFRGWLCTLCNSAIGMLGDNKEGVKKAMNYLNRF